MKTTRTFKRIVLVLMSLLMLLATTMASVVPAFAVGTQIDTQGAGEDIDYFDGFSGDISEQGLETATNTVKNADGSFSIPLATGSPQITFLIHGYGSTASSWSNNYELLGSNGDDLQLNTELKLSYNAKSIVEKLRCDADAVVYYALYQDDLEYDRAFSLRQLPDLCECNSKLNKSQCNCVVPYTVNDYPYINQINNISNHIVVLLETPSSQESNDTVYAQMEYMIDKIVYDVKTLNNGTLPRINLVGHSRGGITAMQYALDHPWLVDSLFAIGTPFLGSDFGKYNEFLGMLGMIDEDGRYQEGIEDIQNPDVYNSYLQRWNEGYNDKYSHINFSTIAGYSSEKFILDILETDPLAFKTLEHFSEWITKEFGKEVQLSVEDVKDLFSALNTCSKPIGIVAALLSWLEHSLEIVNIDLDENGLLDFATYLGSVIHYEISVGYPEWIISDDIFVSCASQLADGYDGVHGYLRRFTFDYDNVDIDMRAEANLAIVHNLEPGDAVIHSIILNNINLGGESDAGNLLSYYVNDGKVSIRGVKSAFDGTVINIPDSIDGYDVVEILPNAFRDLNIEIVFISGYVRIIGEYAFGNCTELSSVTFVGGNQLNVIEDMAFYGCSSLTSFELPITTQIIGDFAFAETAITSIDVPPGIQTISPSAFCGASLEEYTIEMYNYNYSVADGVLYNFDGTQLISYPRLKRRANGAVSTSFVMPDSVTSISEYSFAGASELVNVNLGNVTYLPKGAFQNCVNLERVISTKLEDLADGLYDYTLYGTKLLDANSTVEIGHVLIRYVGDQAEVNCTKYTAISSGAFFGNETLVRVLLGGSINRIGSRAFGECSSLAEVCITTGNFVSIGDVAFDSTLNTIHVPFMHMQSYISDANWSCYADLISSHKTSVTYDSDGGTNLPATEIYYYSFIEFPIPEKENFDFLYWTYETDGVEYQIYNGEIWLFLDQEVELIARWEPSKYSIALNPEGGDVSDDNMDYTVEDDLVLPVPIRRGYLFVGWYSNPDGTGTQYSNEAGALLVPIEAITTSTVLYAKWSPEVYEIKYELNGGVNNNDNPTSYTIESSTITLAAPSRSNYRFDGWYTTATFDGTSKTTGIGSGSAGNITLYAKWTKLYRIEFLDPNGMSIIHRAIGETVVIPSIKAGYLYTYNGQRYNPGASFEVVGDMIFEADDKTLDELYNGSYYPIYTAKQLVAIGDASHNTSGNTYKLMNSIVTSLQTARHIETFYGTLDGNGYTIKNIRVDLDSDDTGAYNCGLVRINRGTISNLVIDSRIIDISEPNTYNSSWVYAGFVAGRNYGTIKNVTVKNCELISSRHTVGMGGIVGINSGSITNCTVSNLKFTGSADMGGIAGVTSGGTIRSCAAEGLTFNIEIDGENRSVGGIVGYAKNSASIISCSVKSTSFVVKSYTLANDVVQPCIGKVVGNLTSSTMQSCTATSSSIDSSALPDPTYFLFVVTHDPELYVGSAANGMCGSNSGTIS